MKKLKVFIVLLMVLVVFDLGLVLVDDGNKLEVVSHDVTVVSCDLKDNTGLDTYYVVKYEYMNGDEKVTGTDNFYKEEVSKGDTIQILDRETVVSPYAKYMFFGQVVINVLVGVVAFCIVMILFNSRKSKEVVDEVEEIEED